MDNLNKKEILGVYLAFSLIFIGCSTLGNTGFSKKMFSNRATTKIMHKCNYKTLQKPLYNINKRSASLQFKSVPFTNFSTPDTTGTVIASGYTKFDSNVMYAGAAIEEWSMSFPNDTKQKLLTIGASISNTRFSDNTVTLNATLTLTDGGLEKICDPQMTALIFAYCE